MMGRLVSEIVPGIYRVGGLWGSGILGANIYCIADDGLTLVDTGFRGRLGAIINSVCSLGYSLQDIRRIIVTHHHPDHTGNLARLKELTGAMVIAHAGDAPYINGILPQPGLQRLTRLAKYMTLLGWSWAFTPVRVDVMVKDGDVLPLLGGMQVVHTPGHTPGSICLWFEQRKVLIVGDVLAHRFGLRLPALMFTADIAQEIRSISRLLGLDFEVICFGHGPPIRGHAREVVAKFVDKVAKRYLHRDVL